ncbi:D-isomer specific 2-hydroxyacid dehydrogenase family protein [Ignisphaera sp. 4213-co]|uniref:D-isomer specific 2-hydroxyacid dehydrogenase family protein n=1 Tax=Ignisphaera cupida TaxID=3050454 RepID=A0ABD4Z8C1_9CREN|nr:D-isomer specific 2-hydroxyacid dehydrogenase family protein [Ignisphaera sp. 4213-co]MDK6029145.1 D-isomer specific 2-hydroxyacid dehydrogenase family protein [Ignisphaera sp. 4213-co]
MIRIAIVNSKSFGLYTDAIEKLKKLGIVDRLEVPRDYRGKLLAEKLRGYHVVVASVTPIYDREFFENNQDVVLIVRHGIGYDNIDVKAAEEFGVTVARVPGWREREAVAEHTIALMLSALRYVVQSYEAVKQGRWGDRAKFIAKELSSLTVGVVGLGNIGSRVAEILSKGFGAKIIVYDPYIPRERVEQLSYKYATSLEELARESDIVTLHAPLTNETYHMINRNVLSKMKKGVIIVNTARGELVDEDALCEYLENGTIAAYAADTVEKEPIGPDHKLLKYPNVIITPHIAAYTWESLKGMDEAVVEAIVNYLENKPIDGVVVKPRISRPLKT